VAKSKDPIDAHENLYFFLVHQGVLNLASGTHVFEFEYDIKLLVTVKQPPASTTAVPQISGDVAKRISEDIAKQVSADAEVRYHGLLGIYSIGVESQLKPLVRLNPATKDPLNVELAVCWCV